MYCTKLPFTSVVNASLNVIVLPTTLLTNVPDPSPLSAAKFCSIPDALCTVISVEPCAKSAVMTGFVITPPVPTLPVTCVPSSIPAT